jgi:hypothetical protein
MDQHVFTGQRQGCRTKADIRKVLSLEKYLLLLLGCFTCTITESILANIPPQQQVIPFPAKPDHSDSKINSTLNLQLQTSAIHSLTSHNPIHPSHPTDAPPLPASDTRLRSTLILPTLPLCSPSPNPTPTPSRSIRLRHPNHPNTPLNLLPPLLRPRLSPQIPQRSEKTTTPAPRRRHLLLFGASAFALVERTRRSSRVRV